MSKKGQAQSGRRYQNNAVDFSHDSVLGVEKVELIMPGLSHSKQTRNQKLL